MIKGFGNWKNIIFQEVIQTNLNERNLSFMVFRDMVRRESMNGMDISLLVMARMFNTVIGVISGDKFWVSHSTLKWNDVKIIVGLSANGSIYSTSNFLL